MAEENKTEELQESAEIKPDEIKPEENKQEETAEGSKPNAADELSESQKEELKRAFNDQLQKFGEVFSQCWESDEFKQAFISDPKAIFREYEINHDPNREYRIIDTPEKTIIHVLPYEGIKPAMAQLTDLFMNKVKDLGDKDSKQILLEDWKWQIYQNTEDVLYIPIPLCPEKLTPEELEMVNGGCIIFAVFFVIMGQSVAVVNTVALAADLAVVAIEAAAVVIALVGIAAGLAVVLLNTAVVYTNAASTGAVAVQFNSTWAWDPSKKSNQSGTGTGTGNALPNVNRRAR